MDLLDILAPALRLHSELVGAGANSERTTHTIEHNPLKTMRLTETYRAQLRVIAESIDKNVNQIINGLSPRQAEQVIAEHKHVTWKYPLEDGEIMYLVCIEGQAGKWVLGFDTFYSENIRNGDKPMLVYRLHDLEIQDVLAFMATCENVLAI